MSTTPAEGGACPGASAGGGPMPTSSLMTGTATTAQRHTERTTVTARVRKARSGAFSDLRDNSAEQIAQRLDYPLGALGASSYRGIILDDLNEIEDPSARRALGRFLSGRRRRDML